MTGRIISGADLKRLQQHSRDYMEKSIDERFEQLVLRACKAARKAMFTEKDRKAIVKSIREIEAALNEALELARESGIDTSEDEVCISLTRQPETISY